MSLFHTSFAWYLPTGSVDLDAGLAACRSAELQLSDFGGVQERLESSYSPWLPPALLSYLDAPFSMSGTEEAVPTPERIERIRRVVTDIAARYSTPTESLDATPVTPDELSDALVLSLAMLAALAEVSATEPVGLSASGRLLTAGWSVQRLPDELDLLLTIAGTAAGTIDEVLVVAQVLRPAHWTIARPETLT